MAPVTATSIQAPHVSQRLDFGAATGSPVRSLAEMWLPQQRRITVGEYMRLVNAGCFEDEHLELIEGVIYVMSPSGPLHSNWISFLIRVLSNHIPEDCHLRCQSGLAVQPHSVPEPDLAVVRGLPLATPDISSHPETASLAIEVSVSSLQFDRNVKGPLYAKANVQEYWILDVGNCCLVFHTDPDPTADTPNYRSITTISGPAPIPTAVLRNWVWSVGELFEAAAIGNTTSTRPTK